MMCADLREWKTPATENLASQTREPFSLEILPARSIETAGPTMPAHKSHRSKPRRIVLKFGSGTLTRPNAPGLDLKQFARLSAEMAALIQRGNECVTVTSGAVAAGMGVLSLTERPTNLATAQASAAVGQSKLMRAYETAFGRYNLNVAQLLLTHSDLDSRIRRENARNTLERLLAARNVIPIINENDSVAVEELKFGDNDRLSAEVAMLAGAGSSHHPHPGRRACSTARAKSFLWCETLIAQKTRQRE